MINNQISNNIEVIPFYTNRKYAKTLLIIGVFHGDEPIGELLIRRFIDKSGIDVELLKNNVLFIPCLNQSGRILNSRKNGNGVDLNRNFPCKNWVLIDKNDDYYGGIEKASEKEVKFLCELIENNNIDFILTIHQPYNIVNYDGPREETYKIAEEIAKITELPICENIGYPTPGSFGTYAGIEKNIPTITLEWGESHDIYLNNVYYKQKRVFEYLLYKF